MPRQYARKENIYIPLWFDYHNAEQAILNIDNVIYIPLWFDYHLILAAILCGAKLFTFHSGLIITVPCISGGAKQ